MKSNEPKIERGYIVYARQFLQMLADMPLLDRVLIKDDTKPKPESLAAALIPTIDGVFNYDQKQAIDPKTACRDR